MRAPFESARAARAVQQTKRDSGCMDERGAQLLKAGAEGEMHSDVAQTSREQLFGWRVCRAEAPARRRAAYVPVAVDNEVAAEAVSEMLGRKLVFVGVTRAS